MLSRPLTMDNLTTYYHQECKISARNQRLKHTDYYEDNEITRMSYEYDSASFPSNSARVRWCWHCSIFARFGYALGTIDHVCIAV